VATGEIVVVTNPRGTVELPVKLFDGLRRGVVIAEGIFPNKSHRKGEGINVLTGSDPVAPRGGAAFHDNRVAIRKV
jgi:anaerobic selenocysteine-containing dehydrogenase